VRRRLMQAGVAAVVVASALVGCSSGDKGDASGGTTAPTAGAKQSSPAASGNSSSAPSGSESGKVEPAQRREIKVDEVKKFSSDKAAYTLTVNKLVVNDYYIEADVRLVNDGTEQLMAWYGASTSSPRLYDDRGREFAFQPQAGGKDRILYLKGGEGLDATIVFAGRLDDSAKSLTLDFTKVNEIYNQVQFEIPVRSS
jgi:hypothetical protein